MPLHIDVSVSDTDDMARHNRAMLDISPVVARALAEETLAIVATGQYIAPSGRPVEIREAVQRSVAAKSSLPPQSPPPPRDSPPNFPTLSITIRNQTTLEAAQQFIEEGTPNALALNFSSPTHPGGGFLSGARAQEECLARSSALYATLRGDLMYTYHAQTRDPRSTAWAILSPDVPIFRHDDGSLLKTPYSCSFLTCAAPIANLIPHAESHALMRTRIHRILDIARCHGCTSLILGAWGCGAFGNDPNIIAHHFRVALLGDFSGDFAEIVFAITDWSPERRFLGPFANAFFP